MTSTALTASSPLPVPSSIRPRPAWRALLLTVLSFMGLFVILAVMAVVMLLVVAVWGVQTLMAIGFGGSA